MSVGEAAETAVHWRRASSQRDLPAPQCLGKSTASGGDDGLVPCEAPRAGHSGHRVDTEISGSPAKPLRPERSWAEGPDLPPRRTHTHTHAHPGRLPECRATDCRAATGHFGYFRARSASPRPPPSALRRQPSAALGRRREEPSAAEAASEPAVRVPAGRCPPREPPESRSRAGTCPPAGTTPAPAAASHSPAPPQRQPLPGLRSAACNTPPPRSLHLIHTQLCCLSPSLSNPPSPGGPLPATDPAATTGIAKQQPLRASPPPKSRTQTSARACSVMAPASNQPIMSVSEGGQGISLYFN